MKMNVAVGSDHAGFDYKKKIVAYIAKRGLEVKDFGTHTPDPVDYPDCVHPVARAVECGDYEFGIFICGSGNGAAMTANKHQGIRAALCWTAELADLSRAHNDANILCIPERFVDYQAVPKMIEAFLFTDFYSGTRHERRVNKIPC